VSAGSRVAGRLAELGLTLPAVAAPVAAYVPAVVDGDLVWTSGQLPFVDGVLQATGVVGDGEGLVPPQDAAHLARLCALNALAAVGSVVDLDRVTRIVKVVGFVASGPGFTGQPGVVNGASELLGQVFAGTGGHARSAVGVAQLPLGAPVEVELVASLR
jgi:enamine deaminase RidA (YjgF/YER057c/UK114 family)